MGHEIFSFRLTETLFDSAFHAYKTRPELILSQFPDAAHAAVTQVIDIVDLAATVTQVDQNPDDRQDIVVNKRHRACEFLAADTAIKFHPADLG